MPFQILSRNVPDGGMIPDIHSCQGADLSPSLEWSGEPANTRSFALLVEDPDAPNGIFCHWVLYDIASKTHTLPQGAKPGSAGSDLGTSGANDFKRVGYGGPCPPQGSTHRYYFRLYALDVHTLGLSAGAGRAALLQSITGHVLAQTQFMARFHR